MDDVTHVRFVDAHAEGDGRDHDDIVFFLKALLAFRAERGVETGVIGERRDF